MFEIFYIKGNFIPNIMYPPVMASVTIYLKLRIIPTSLLLLRPFIPSLLLLRPFIPTLLQLRSFIPTLLLLRPFYYSTPQQLNQLEFQ